MSQVGPGTATPTAMLPWPLLTAPATWCKIDFISDLHLKASQMATFDAWHAYMQNTVADAVFILGDLFDVWIGDDVLGDTVETAIHDAKSEAGFEARCAHVLKSAAKRHEIFFMPGNRDFLLGQSFAGQVGWSVLPDPVTLDFGGQRWLLSHGDALCLDDSDYLEFRAKVRGTDWQQDFLRKSLAERRSIGRDLRRQSEARKKSGVNYGDIDEKAASHWLEAAQACALIHGHTHQPADHRLSNGLQRHVLSDWDASAEPRRLEFLRLVAASDQNQVGCKLERIRL
jgi:UDP-2,3-diacylglucosamine hydrolase